MERIVWDDKFNIGVEVVDKAHAKLFRIVGKLLDIPPNAKINQQTYKEGIKYLEAYSMTHFSEEEGYMRSIRYNGYARHKRIHDDFRDKTLISLRKDLVLSDYSLSAVQRFAGTMNSWLAEHIMREDQAIVGKVASQKNYDFSSKLPIISRTINRAMQDVFQVEAKLISADYKGQNIGNGFYGCQYYDIEGGVRLQLLLGVEEPLLLRGINRMLETQMIQKNEIMDEDILQVFGQLFQDISKLFRVETEGEFSKDNLLDKDKFRTDFMKGYPCSLLFSTKIGYCIFCYRSWRTKKKLEAVARKE
ncbi:hemerythrin family protein [Lachnospiraceae bacterium 62-35]